MAKAPSLILALIVAAAAGGATAAPRGNGSIAYIRTIAGGHDTFTDAIVVANGDGSHPRLVVRDADSPAWAPNGDRLVFQRTVRGDYELFVVNRNGTGLRRIKNRGRDDFSPA